ncbi:MAG: MBL fold metallo-hydrolase [Lachnospiraceae bacterium]
MITELKYSNTNTYLIKGNDGYILFDTDWAGTFSLFCKELGEKEIRAQDIKYLFISHFHPDHMGIAQEIADLGITIVVADVQEAFIHSSDSVFAKDKRKNFKPIDDSKVQLITIAESRDFLRKIGIDGEILYTPGHSDDSISLCLDEGVLLVGDLNPLYELEMHKGTQIAKSWELLLERNPKKIYYGHAKAAIMDVSADYDEDYDVNDEKKRIVKDGNGIEKIGMGRTGIDRTGMDRTEKEKSERYALVQRIMKYIDRGYPIDKIQKKTRADKAFIEDVTRMYLTHQNVSVQGILDRIEIKNR